MVFDPPRGIEVISRQNVPVDGMEGSEGRRVDTAQAQARSILDIT